MIALHRPADGAVTQQFGNTQPDGLPHAGTDYAYYTDGRVTDAVYAAADGLVLFADDSRALAWPNLMYLNPDFDRSDDVDSSAGNYIMIQHLDGSVPVALTGYGHLATWTVKEGDWVTAGQRIATIGDTGNTRGKHLHFDYMPYPLDYDTITYGRVDPQPLMVATFDYAGTITPLTEQDNDMAALSDEEQRELLGNTRTIMAMLDNIAAFQNESGTETRDNARKIVYATVDQEKTSG